MTVKCRAGEFTGCPVTVPTPHTKALSGRSPEPGHCGIAPLINELNRLISLAAGLPPLVHPPARARREEYYLCPPIHLQALPGTREDACNRFCCAAASTTLTGPPANCSTVTPPSTSPAVSCRSRVRPAARPSARPVLRSTGRTPTSSSAPG